MKFVVSHAGLMYGPFDTPEEAVGYAVYMLTPPHARFNTPWSIVAINGVDAPPCPGTWADAKAAKDAERRARMAHLEAAE